MANNNQESWLNCIQTIFKFLNIEHLYLNATSYKHTYIINKIRHKLKMKLIDIWFKDINNDIKSKAKVGNKLRTYRKFKYIYQLEPYLNIGSENQRKYLTKLRLSDHDLNIERGRYTNLEIHQRICYMCKNEVEDEKHFLLNCPNLEEIRKPFIEEINDKYCNFKNLCIDNKFLWLMSNEDTSVIKLLLKLVVELKEKRNVLIS